MGSQPQAAASFGSQSAYAIGSQGVSGSGYMQSLGVEAPRENAGMGISFGSWGAALGAAESEPSTSSNGVTSYGGDQPAVEIPPVSPQQPVRSPPKPEESSDYPSSSMDAAQMAQMAQMAGYVQQQMFQSDDSVQQQPAQGTHAQQYQYAQQQAFDYSQYSDPAQGFAGQAGETAAATGATGDKASGEVPNQQANMYQQFSHAGHAAYPTNNFYYPQHMTQQPAQQYSQHMAQQPNPNAYW